MAEETRALHHKLQNAEQEKLALKSLVERAADEIDHLAEADCSKEAIENAREQARRLRKVAKTDSSE